MAENIKILFYPIELRHHNKLRYVLEYLDIEWTNDIDDNWTIAVFWDFKTTRDNPLEFGNNRRVINYDCVTADKKHVDLIFEKVFGYSCNIDPIKFKGSCIVKSIEQAAHNGKIIQCPIKEKEKDVVYQKIIDTRIDEKHIKDIRVPIFKDQISCVFEKIRLSTRLFGGFKGIKLNFVNVDDIFSEEEQGLILEFCRQMNVEYCELDILRSNFDGKIYIVDMNPTPSGGLYIKMGHEKKLTKRIIKEYSEMFYEKFLK